jgi:SAM-dependent methyltransferase
MKKRDTSTLNDYLIRANSLLQRTEELKLKYGNEVSEEYLDWIDTEGIIYQRELQDVGVPFPDWKDMLTVGGETNLRMFLDIGKDTFNWIKPYLPQSSQKIKVLDFGIGCARTARHFYRHQNKFDIYGCDVDRNAIHWLKKNVSFLNSSHSSPRPPLPYSSEYFDCVYAISVFSHLNENYFEMWLKEIFRCLKPNGKLMFTYHGLSAFEKIEKNSLQQTLNIKDWSYLSLKKELEIKEFTWISQYVGSLDIDIDSYGISFTTLGKIKNFISNRFTVAHYTESIGGWQDLIVLQKIHSS